MELTLALLADYANISREGKLNIMGIFEQIHAQQFPATHPQMHLVIRLEATPFEAGPHTVGLSFIDDDANEVFSIHAPLAIPESSAGQNLIAPSIFALNAIAFPKAGMYEFVITVDAQELGRVPLRVLRLPSQPMSN
jgi:hypothetical protein